MAIQVDVAINDFKVRRVWLFLSLLFERLAKFCDERAISVRVSARRRKQP